MNPPMTASPTPFFAESANKSDHSGDANKMVAPDSTCAENAQVQPAPAAMPSEEEIEAEIRPMSYEGADLTECVARTLALFAPVLAEKERREAAHNIVRETFAYHVAESVDGLCKIPRRVADDMAQSYASLEARALAAEAALAAERANAVDGSIDIRLDDKGGIDEVFGNGVLCHIERMSKGEWFVIMTRPDQSQEAFWLTGKGKVEFTLHEHRKAPTTGPNVDPWTVAAIRSQEQP